ncbi:MAG: hypothetical protein PPFGHCPK_01533 (plasmid) [Spiroplasma endosymbiont of Drosophila atripex]|nr:MAG: hypothetical protein PPFGHCPK_01533 [Spiroplasma endosymbiont of Drosophila atripex]
MPNVIKKKLNIQTQNVSSPTDMIIKTASYSGVKNFKKVDENFVMPRMTCDQELVKQFRKEAQEKQWSYTTLMNNILKERYKNINIESENE